MVDLQEAVVSVHQDDERLHTFVVHVPTLGAKEADVPAAMELLNGPRVTHYWNGGRGETGHLYQETLGIERYAWDVWMVYPSGITWDEQVPPEPSYWQHQLGIDQGAEFDPEAFAAETSELMDLAAR